MTDIEKALWDLYDNMKQLNRRELILLKSSIELILPNEQLMLDAVKLYIRDKQGIEQ